MIIYPDGKLEGTPEELATYKQMLDRQKNPTTTLKDLVIKPDTGTGCPAGDGPCYCTGACVGTGCTSITYAGGEG